MIKYNDYPLEEIGEAVEGHLAAGHDVYQKFSCEECGNRLTMEESGIFYEQGKCDKCGHVTDLTKTGCNYMVIMRTKVL